MALSNLTVRLDENDKNKFSEICEKIGLSVSAAINVFVKKVVSEHKIPFERHIHVTLLPQPNAHSTILLHENYLPKFLSLAATVFSCCSLHILNNNYITHSNFAGV